MIDGGNLLGLAVGAQRWPYQCSHPDCWGEPHRGTVIAADDARAWAKTTAFPSETPDAEAVKAHVAYCRRNSWLDDKAPVLWNFPDGDQVFWETVDSLRPAEQDHEEWLFARAAAYDREQARRKTA